MRQSSSRSVRIGLLTTTVLAGFAALGGQALAQTSTDAGTIQAGQSSAAVAGAPQGAQNAGQVSSGGVSQDGQPSPNASTGGTGSSVQEVVVTGSILRRKLSDTDAPITTVTASDLQNRGITTVANAIQQLSANGAAALPNSFTANGAFAAGASAVSLRGLTSNSTLTLVDGQRMTYYPLADDGTRNFVDLNTIPDVIVDRIEVLKDGASSIYGADAIAGVVNVITKKSYEGVTVKAEGGGSQQGGGSENNFQALVGYGNLARDGYNVYLGLEYEHDLPLYNRDRGYPYNTADQSQTCGASLGVPDGMGGYTIAPGSRTCRTNGVANGLQFDNSFEGVGSTIVPVVRPYANANTTTAAGDYQLLNPAAGCGGLKTVTVTPAQAAAGGASGIANGPVTLCQQDFTHDYGEISPDDKRFSASIRATKEFGANTEAYFEGNYYQNDVISNGDSFLVNSARQQATPGAVGLTPYSTAGTPGVTLPVYVCPQGSATFVCGAGSAGAVLNPNNPFAAAGEVASLRYVFGDIPVSSEQFSQTYRFAAGVKGDFNLFGDWKYTVDLTGSQTDLRNTQNGDIYIAGLLQAVNTGAYNFLNPAANTAAVRDLIAPQSNQYSSSRLGAVQVNLSRNLLALPGGDMQLGIFGGVRYESIFDPSANPDTDGSLNPNRYFGINPFGVIGSRNVRDGGFELDSPILKQIDVNISGRYDDYSTGQSNFSPKVGATIHPFRDWAPEFDRITLRSTFSQGFRIPSLAETDAVAPTTGFTTGTAPASFQALHGNDGYGLGYSLGQQIVSNPNLKPERSNNFTAGIVLDPIRQVSISFDYYRIEKRDFITPNYSGVGAALAAYFAGQPIPAPYQIVPGIPDPNSPNTLATPGFIAIPFTNLGTETTSGYDIGATARFNLPYGMHYTSVFDGNYVLSLNLDPMNGNPVQHYAGTIGPFNDVAAGGTPKFRANWQNTLSRGPVSATLTAYFTDGYDLQAADFGDTPGVCTAGGATASAINTVYLDGVTPVRCKVKPFWDVDAHFTYDVTHHIQFYLDVQNLFDKSAPYDPTTYGGVDYNSTFANQGIYGRYFKVGARATF